MIPRKERDILIHFFNKCLSNISSVAGTEGNKNMNGIIRSNCLFEDTYT